MTKPQTAETVLVEALEKIATEGSCPNGDVHLQRTARTALKAYDALVQPLPREGEWVTELIAREGMAMAKAYTLGSPESRAIVSTVEHIRAMLAAAPPPHDGRGEVEDETAWLIEETWSGFVHYVHKDFNCAKWAEENRKNDASRRNGMPPRYPAVLITKDIEQAMQFPTEDAAHTWLAMQPCWMNGGGPEDQYQVREHMWSSPTDWKARAETAEAQLADVRDTMITAMNNRDEWMELAHKTNAQFAEAKGEVERLTAEINNDDGKWFGPFQKAAAEVDRLNKWADGFSDAQLKERATAEEYQRELKATITTLTTQRDRLLEAGKPFVDYFALYERYRPTEADHDPMPVACFTTPGGFQPEGRPHCLHIHNFRALKAAHGACHD